MAITQETHWDNVGTEPGAGDAEYVAGQQPISEHDNWFNWSAAKDVENLIAALENVATGHNHDGTNSKKVDGSDVVNTPAGTIVATDVQAAIDELDTEKESTSTSHASRHVTGGGDVIANAIAAGNAGLMTGADKTKLNGVEALADVTDATNVNAAGAAMNSDKDIANGIAGLDASVKSLWDQLPLPMLTVAQFQANAATGTADNPHTINNTSIIDAANFDVIGEYAQVLFPHPMWIKEYRQYGFSGITGDGIWKIQIYHDGAWIDNTVAIPLRILESWSDWVALTIPVYTQGIRFVATAIDSSMGISAVRELEIRG